MRRLRWGLGVFLLVLPSAIHAQGCAGLPAIAAMRGAFTQSTTTDGADRASTSALTIALSRALVVGARYTRESYQVEPGVPPNANGPGASLALEWMAGRARAISLCPTVSLTALRSSTLQLGPGDAVSWSGTRFAPGFAIGARRALTDDVEWIPFAATAVVLESYAGDEAAGQPASRAYAVAELGVSVLLWKAIALRWTTGQALGAGARYPVPIVRNTLAASVAWTR
jgi:hypothetical protein